MLNVSKVVRQLKKERDETRAKLNQVETALKILGDGRAAGRRSGRMSTPAKRRTMSVAARKRIAAAQRVRWAKWKAARGRK
jgi:hypothetical protein